MSLVPLAGLQNLSLWQDRARAELVGLPRYFLRNGRQIILIISSLPRIRANFFFSLSPRDEHVSRSSWNFQVFQLLCYSYYSSARERLLKKIVLECWILHFLALGFLSDNTYNEYHDFVLFRSTILCYIENGGEIVSCIETKKTV